jgi:hypothetical protein
MIKFEELQEANGSIITTKIQGKEYAQVNQRIKAFRMIFPEGTIKTEIVKLEAGICVIKASVYDREILLAEGTAYEKEGSSYINKTSYIENCETSAVGRALGMAGFGIDTSIASAEEVENAINIQDNLITATDEKILQKLIKGLETEASEFYNEILEKYNIKGLNELTKYQYGEILHDYKALKGE